LSKRSFLKAESPLESKEPQGDWALIERSNSPFKVQRDLPKRRGFRAPYLTYKPLGPKALKPRVGGGHSECASEVAVSVARR
jgi:hypothetical protein